MKIFHCSDTHGWHDNLILPENIDILIHSGDSCNSRNPIDNATEFFDFIRWLTKIRSKFKHVILTFGNHETWPEKNEKKARKLIKDAGAILLINESVCIDGIKIWGSPVTPAFHDWAYNRDRSKIAKLWATIPEDTEILITHGPPKGILDLSENKDHELEQCGDKALATRIKGLKSLKYWLGGHIHDDTKSCKNQGVLIRESVVYSNASCVTDGKFKKGLSSHGNLLEF